MDSEPSARETPFAVDLVKEFLRGQNLEQLGRVDEAIDLYEHSISAGFDSPGPYDRLIEMDLAPLPNPGAGALIE